VKVDESVQFSERDELVAMPRVVEVTEGRVEVKISVQFSEELGSVAMP
jgi:hypothetical protein